MRIVVIGGQARKVGKTSVMAAVIRATRRLDWTAVKVSTHQGSTPHAGRSVECHGGLDLPYLLTEEKVASPLTDTGRYLAAGARRAFWLRVRSESLEEGVTALLGTITNEKNVMIESGSVLSVLRPRVAILVLDRARGEVKTSFRRALARADAVVEIASGKCRTVRLPRLPYGIHRFNVSRKNYSNAPLSRFILLRLKRLK
jgi:hypothetical protein